MVPNLSEGDAQAQELLLIQLRDGAPVVRDVGVFAHLQHVVVHLD